MNTERYDRQIKLKGFGPHGQEFLAQSRVLLVGAGGLGVPAALYLNAMGVGRLGLIDGDQVELSNLHRQPIYTEADLGKLKVDCLSRFLKQQNPKSSITVLDTFLHARNALEILASYDLIIDATDNLETRYLLDDACLMLDKPWIYGALHGFEGQVSVFNYQGGPTYRCLFPKMPEQGEIPDCNTLGTLGILPAIIGSFQALEAVKVLCDLEGVLSGKLMIFEGLEQQSRTIAFKRNPNRAIPKEIVAENYNANLCDSGSEAVSYESYLRERNSNQTALIDVREISEFENGSLPEARIVPLSNLKGTLDQHNSDGKAVQELFGKDTSRATRIFLICKSGPRSRVACSLLSQYFPEYEFAWIEGGMRSIKTTSR
ncbi:adenylyltransferase and sulfurtransferase [Robiginitalea myxolifaciens]|uniref:Molybdopterin-synthase adenylyltransferase n=1 Tax=Robiginitalea myxolifaciens TaxID=400055 RepID=A0A1I6GXP7_9FLAO|nr:HesA/MoeB/ThiF family protein [Robiginitalea myxolifaciens]SFR47024.1 adenylyltransferase and sulfurtransferase [Robiginitalea myxolifaciens]